MRRFFTTTKLTRNNSSFLSPKNLNNELEAKENFQIKDQRVRPSVSSPQRTALTPKRRLITTPMSGIMSNNRDICRQSSKLWIESIPQEVLVKVKESLSVCEMKRQEAIYELMSGELDVCYDLGLIEATYQNSLINLEIIDETEAFQIFGDLHALHSVHLSLFKLLDANRDHNGVFGSVGKILMEWTPKLNVCESYCSNQRTAKQLLELKIKNDKRMDDFLQRCLQSPFSRRLDLWAFLDVPRTRLVKYPLLFQSIRKYSPENSSEFKAIEFAICLIQKIIKRVDYLMGEEECKVLLSKIEFDRNCETNNCLINSKAIICSGILKNSRGTKLLCILFNTCFVLTRPNDCGVFVLYRQPILIDELRFDSGNHIKIGGSLNRTFNGSTNSNKSFVFRVYSTIRDITFTLQASDAHDLRMWSNKLTQVCTSNALKQITTNPTIPKIMPRNTDPIKEQKSNETQALKACSPRKKIKYCNEDSFNEMIV
jgi:hypothetical protein